MKLEAFRFRAMGSPCCIQLWSDSRQAAQEAAGQATAEVERLEAKYSRYREDSLASEINRSAGQTSGLVLDDETAALLDFAETSYQESEGRFDPTSGVLRRVWDFRSQKLPSAEELRKIRKLVGWGKLSWEKPRLVLPIRGMELDFGGFVKEYAADCAAALCRSFGIASGIVDLGGDLAVIGPHPSGAPWLIGIRNPRNPDQAIARIALRQGGLASSGDYERFMIVEGKRYSHLLDPRTGESFQNGPASVSVTADHCLIAGVSSTIAMLHSLNEAKNFLARVGLPHLLIDQQGSIQGTANVIPRSVNSHSGSESITRSVNQPS